MIYRSHKTIQSTCIIYSSKMTEEMYVKSDQVVCLNNNTLLEKLNYYFHHPTFKNDLQRNAIITILKRKCIASLLFIIILTIHFFKENVMYLCQCQLDLESHYVINYPLYFIHLKLQ